jgi:hypothetical protein
LLAVHLGGQDLGLGVPDLNPGVDEHGEASGPGAQAGSQTVSSARNSVPRMPIVAVGVRRP